LETFITISVDFEWTERFDVTLSPPLDGRRGVIFFIEIGLTSGFWDDG
jgi:hypothetical protein